MRDNKELTKIVAASLLGDGHVTKEPEGRNSHYELNQVITHRDYTDFIKNRLSELTRVRETIRSFKHSMPNAKDQIVLKTMSLPFYTKFRNRMYGTGVKAVDPHYLTLIDAEFMAIWYMEDGSRAVNEANSQESVYLYTDSFSYGDNDLLRKAIMEKTGFVFNIHQRKNKHGLIKYRLYLYKKQNQRFFEYVAPHILPSFSYKLSERLAPAERL